MQGNATVRKGPLERWLEGRSVLCAPQEQVPEQGFPFWPANSRVGQPAEPGCTFWQVKERERWVWRSVGVQELTQCRVRSDREEPEAQVSAEVAPVHVLLWCHTTLSWWGCWSAEGSPRASHPLSPSGICHKVLELHGLTSSGVSSVTVPVQQQQEQICVLDEDQWSWHYLPHSHCI